jgi:AcrR family transcriptional regulator
MEATTRATHLYDAFLRKIPRQSRSRSVVEAILVAASERLQRDGDESLALEGIAARAGVGIGSLYDYFRDRQGVLAGVVAKITEDNLDAFERRLEESRDQPLEDFAAAIVDYVVATYIADPKVARLALRMAYQLGLVPTLAETQTLFARSLAQALAARKDLGPPRDYTATAYVLTHAAMGLVHSRLWEAAPPISTQALRDELVSLVLAAVRPT